MKVRKAIKKIAALGAGVTMMGATLLGATAAADLTDFPSFFIENGKFNGYFVVGDNAISQDVVGVTAIASRMQAESVKTTYVSAGAAGTSSVDDGIKFDKSSDHLYLGNDLEDLYQSFDETDLPVLLAKGTYDENEGDTDNDEEYTQNIEFTDANGVVGVYQDDQQAPTAGWYLFFDDNAFMYTYTLEFDGTID
jgi:S-layer protein (TIGR01564 family)